MTADDPADADAQTAAALARELEAKQPALELVLQPVSVLQLVALVQLALRHPGVTRELRATGARFIDGALDYFADCPTVCDTIRRGNDPREDL